MSFSSLEYIIFFGIVLVVMAISNALKSKCKIETVQQIRHVFLLIMSYIFYGWADMKFCFLMLALTIVSYVTSLIVAKRDKYEKAATVLGVVTPLVILGIFKYFNFFVDSFAQLLHTSSSVTLSLVLPVGISFYTFQSLSYTIDVKRGKIEAQKDFINLALYISFFPQLVAGPIVKAEDFIPQLHEDRSVSLKNLEKGLQIFVLGLFKKIVIADRLSIFVDEVFETPSAFSALTVVLAVISYSIQIYFDFSGYSDMAIGSAKCLGFDLRRNFNFPYISKNVSEFWKRWHISLSSWLMEYLYIPLGGNRKGVARTYINLVITMLLGGLWHGASWTFVAWGLFHGIGLCVHKLYKKIRKLPKDYKGSTIPNIISTVCTYIFVCFGWIFFRAESFANAWDVFRAMFTLQGGVQHYYIWTFVAIAVVIVRFVSVTLRNKKANEALTTDSYIYLPLDKTWGLTLFSLFIMLTAALAYFSSNPFIYFRF